MILPNLTMSIAEAAETAETEIKETNKLVNLLSRMDRGYTPTEEEQKWISEITYFPLFPGNILFSKLPESIGKLINLKSLSLDGTNLTTLPAWAGSLSNLEYLHLNRMNFTTLPNWIETLSNLKELDLRWSNLTILPDWIGNLSNLKYLYLSSTNLTTLPDWIGNLNHLETLGLKNLKLYSIPKSILNLNLGFYFGKYYKNGYICIKNTKLATQPIQLFAQPRKLIEEYYNAPKVEIKDAKVIFLGNGGAGKTHTIERILNEGKRLGRDTATTDGIDIHSHDVDDHMTVKFWDFGGQEIMHSMHRCFLTGRSLYVVVVANRNDSDSLTSQAEYWLKNIESFAPGCPVLIAINKIDGNNNTGMNLTHLKEKYPNIIGQSIEYNAKGDTQNNAGEEDEFAYLTKRIFEEAHKLDSVGMEFPEKWETIRQDLLKKQKQNVYHIDKEDYHSICAGKEDNPDIRRWLLEWFNDMGICFSYHQENGEELENYKILNPEWLTNAIYIIINKGKSQAKDGKTTKAAVFDWLKNEGKISYQEDEVEYVLQIMRKFRLSYRIDAENEFIPEICSANTPEAFHKTPYQRHYSYQLEYEYLPDSVIHRLMISCYDYLTPKKFYRKGFCMELPYVKTTAVVDMGTSITTMTIDIYTDGEGSPYQFYQWLRSLIEEVNRSLGLSIKTESVIGETNGKRSNPIPISYLLECHLDGESSISYPAEDNSRMKFSLDDLLGSAFNRELIQEAQKEMTKEELYGKDDHAAEALILLRKLVALSEERNDLARVQNAKSDWLTEAVEQLRRENNAQLQRLALQMESAGKKKAGQIFMDFYHAAGTAVTLTPVMQNIFTMIQHLT